MEITKAKQTIQMLTYSRSTKGSHVYLNEVFPAVYIPKVVLSSLTEDPRTPPQFIKMTIEVE